VSLRQTKGAAAHRVRQVKPRVSLAGNDGIPLRDMWELEREL
jgi:hypothetical protein